MRNKTKRGIYFLLFSFLIFIVIFKVFGIQFSIALQTVDSDTIGHKSFSRSTSNIFYNRVAKCASRSTSNILKRIAKENKSYHYISVESWPAHFLTPAESKQYVEKFRNYPKPYVAAGPMYFLDFTKYKSSNPTYINLVRDPIDIASSKYHYNIHGDKENQQRNKLELSNKAQEFKNFTFEECLLHKLHPYCETITFSQIKVFCGHEEICRKSSKKSLSQAKKNVLENFIVVGLFEDMPMFFEVLEKSMPHFFHGASALYSKMESEYSTKFKTYKKKSTSEMTHSRLKHLFTYEYEFYEFIKQRMIIQKHILDQSSAMII